MEPVIVKQGKREYAFYSDKIVVKKKNKITWEVPYDDIDEISYNPKFGFRDFFKRLGGAFIAYPDCRCSKNAFVIFLKSNNDIFLTPLSNEDFERIKHLFKIPIKIV